MKWVSRREDTDINFKYVGVKVSRGHSRSDRYYTWEALESDFACMCIFAMGSGIVTKATDQLGAATRRGGFKGGRIG